MHDTRLCFCVSSNLIYILYWSHEDETGYVRVKEHVPSGLSSLASVFLKLTIKRCK